MVFYRQIIKKAWLTTWRNKKIWLFGFFAAWLGTAGEPELIIRSLNFSPDSNLIQIWRIIKSSGLFTADGLSNLKIFINNHPIQFLKLSLILLIIIAIPLFIFWLIVVAQSALIHSIALLNVDKKTNLGSSWRFGIKKFWPMSGINIIEIAIISFSFYILSSLVFLDKLTFVIIFNFTTIIIIISSFIMKYSACWIVLHNEKFFSAIKKGVKLFYQNWLSSLELAVAFFLINFIISLLLVFAILMVYIAFSFAISLSLILKFTIAVWFSFGLMGLIISFLIIFSAAILATLYWSAWTLMFIHLVTGIKMSSPIINIAKNLFLRFKK